MVWRSFATKLALLIAILITVPAVLYGQFRSADIERTALLQRSVQEEGRLIAATLTPILANFGDGAAAKIGVQLAEIGGARHQRQTAVPPDRGPGRGGILLHRRQPAGYS